MVFFPHCKINLGLNVVSKRPDGYHEIETCFYPVPWTDILEIIPADKFTFTHSGLSIPGGLEENLCLKAYSAMEKKFKLKPVQIHLHKVIPMGAGLGGGSSNAAFTLRKLNEIFGLNLNVSQLKEYAAELGSDCAFFIEDKPIMGTGRGEVLNPVQIKLAGKFIVLVKPDVHVSTKDAYAGVKPALGRWRIKDIIENTDLTTWRNSLVNDFEESVFKMHPIIHEVKEKLYQCGAVYASMSGSGSSVYGIFDEPINLQSQFQNNTYWGGTLRN